MFDYKIAYRICFVFTGFFFFVGCYHNDRFFSSPFSAFGFIWTFISPKSVWFFSPIEYWNQHPNKSTPNYFIAVKIRPIIALAKWPVTASAIEVGKKNDLEHLKCNFNRQKKKNRMVFNKAILAFQALHYWWQARAWKLARLKNIAPPIERCRTVKIIITIIAIQQMSSHIEVFFFPFIASKRFSI